MGLIMLLQQVDRLVITTDLLSASANVAYATYTGHFIDSHWQL